MNPSDTPKTILLVEDDAIIAMDESAMLANNGYTMIVAYSGEEAVRICAGSGGVDLVLMDIDLGDGMDGTEAAREILKARDIPVLFLSSHTEKEIVDRTEKITSYGYVVKNSGEVVLLASIKMAFRLSDANRKVKNELAERSRAENELKSSLKNLRRSQSIARIGNWTLDLATNIFTASEEGLRLFGILDQASPTFDEIASLIDDADRPRLRAVVSESLKTGNPYRVEMLIRTRDTGERRHILSIGEVERDENGSPVKIAGLNLDITERKLSEIALRESEELVRKKLDAILRPEGDIGTLSLSDVLDPGALQSMMDDFYTLTGIGVAILDIDGNVLVATGWQDICTRFHRVHPETSEYCRKSDLGLSSGVPPGTFKLYRCMNNMWDMATPIILSGRHMGNLFLGQFFFDDERPDRNLFREQAQRYGFNEEEYLAALDRVPKWSREKVNTVMTFYSKLAELLSMLSFSNIKLARTLSERDTLLEKLKESEEHYRNLAEDIPAFISTFLPDGTLTYVNSSLAAIDGLTPQEMTGRCVYDLLPEGEPRRIIENLKALTPDNPIETHEQRYVRKDGRSIVQQWTNRAFFDETGRVTRFQAIGRDVTEYKMIEDALRESENRNRALLDVIPDLLFIMNANGVFIDYRGSMESLLLAPDVFVGRTIQETIPEIADRVLAAIGNLFSTRKSQTVEYQLEMNDGMHFYEARLVMMNEEHALAIVRDITGQKKAEQDKLASDEKYHAFINASLDMVYLKDEKLRYAMINSNLAEYFGMSVESVIGRTDFELMPVDAADNCRKSDLATLKLNSIVVTEEEVGDKIFETRKFPVTVGGVTVIGGFIRDITEMKRTERELELALEQKQALLSELQHRIKNTLMMISSMVSLEASASGEPVVKKELGNVRSRIETLSNLYSILYSSGNTKTVQLDRYFNTIVESLLTAFMPVVKTIDVRKTFETITVDTRRASPMGLILNELVTNSIKYAFKEGGVNTLLIELRHVNGEIEFSVFDNGPGLPDDFDLERSTGFGLRLALMLAGQLKGRIEFERAAGTRFVCRAPMTA